MKSNGAPAPAFEVTGLKKSFGGVHALNGVSFALSPGELCGIIGPNGSGKSTLFDCCCGLVLPDAGNVTVDGQDITAWPMHKIATSARVVRSFQRNILMGSMSVEENLILAGQTAKFRSVARTFMSGPRSSALLAELREEANRLIDDVGLAPVRNHQASAISIGQQRLVQFAAALMIKPKVLLLDEPLAGVNPVLIKRLLEIVRRVNQERKVTIAVIEHDMDSIMELCPRIVVLNAGAVIADGTPTQVTRDPLVREAYLGT